MRLLGSINAKHRRARAYQSTLAHRRRSLFARHSQRMHHADGCGVVHHASKLLWQMHPLADPIDHQRFQFSRRR